MDYDRSGIDWIRIGDFPDKMEQWSWETGNTVVGPGSEMVLYDDPFLLGAFLVESKGPHCVVCQNHHLLDMH